MESEIVKWIGTIFLAISGIVISVSPKYAAEWWAFVGFLFGHIIWSIMAIIAEDYSLLVMNLLFLVLDIYAIHIRINNKLEVIK